MKIDIGKQVFYWLNGANEDLEVSKILIQKRRYFHGLFFCHLVLEKALKAHVVSHTKELAPKSHNLIYLSEKSGLEFLDSQLDFFGVLMKYQLEGRYPEFQPLIPKKGTVEKYLLQTEEQLQWLKEKLSNY